MTILERCGLRFNPFDPVASGPPVGVPLVAPLSVERELRERLEAQKVTAGPKLTVIVGEYGSGKTYCLRWLEKEVFPKLEVQPFYFQDPGVQFYDLANSWLRMIGRKNLAKTLWELIHTKVRGQQSDLFASGYEAYARKARTITQARQQALPLIQLFQESGVTDDEEIAHCLARIVVETPLKPNFEYRDFVARSPGAVVAEREEPRYFEALLKALATGSEARGIAFLLDEFEEIGLNDRTRRRTARHYVTTLKRLIDLTGCDSPALWVVLSMTPEAYRQTEVDVPGFTDRMASPGAHIELTAQTREQAVRLMETRLEWARDHSREDLFPFPEDVGGFGERVLSSPRRLVQTCSVALSEAKTETALPFEETYVAAIVERLYPEESHEQESS